MALKRKREAISLETKYAVIRAVEENQKYSEIMKKFGLKNKANISRILKRKSDIKKNFEENKNCKRKTLKTTPFENVEIELKNFLTVCNNKTVPVNGLFLKERAKEIAIKNGHEKFEATNGWMDRFCRRNQIFLKKVFGESGIVDQETSDDWIKNRIPQIVAGFPHENIYNCDELGLFFRLKPSRTYTSLKNSCKGGKLRKERITVLMCTNCDGSDKKPLLVIGKSDKPQCFKSRFWLPTNYKSNKTAWMTKSIFLNWLKNWNSELAKANRRILLFLDNCPSHPFISLSHIRLIFFPVNTTSVLQPCDQGIIKCFKGYYRKRLIQKLITMIDNGKEPSELKINLLDAMYMAKAAWNEVKQSTIKNCFKKAGFKFDMMENELEESKIDSQIESTNDTVNSEIWECLASNLGIEGADKVEYITADDGIDVHEEDNGINLKELEKENEEEGEEEEREDEETIPNITFSNAMQSVQNLQYFFMQNNLDIDLNHLFDKIFDLKMNKMKQTLIFDFFKSI